MARKKSLNPFKLWGSYVGALVFPLFVFIQPLFKYLIDVIRLSGESTTPIFSSIVLGTWKCAFLFTGCSGLDEIGAIFVYISIPLGFLIGWGIHALVRTLRN